MSKSNQEKSAFNLIVTVPYVSFKIHIRLLALPILNLICFNTNRQDFIVHQYIKNIKLAQLQHIIFKKKTQKSCNVIMAPLL